MVEAETVTSPVDNGLQQLMDLSEQLYKDTLEMLLKRNSDDLKLFHDQLANRDAKVNEWPDWIVAAVDDVIVSSLCPVECC